MSEGRQIGSLVALGAVAWAALAYLVVATNPDFALNRFAFFAALYVGLLAWLSIGAYALSFRLFSRKRYRGNVSRSIQHGIVAATILEAAVLLQSARALSLLAVALLMAVFLIAQGAVLLRR